MSDLEELYKVNKRYDWIGDRNVWVEFGQLALKHNAVNLGQVIENQVKSNILSINY